MAVVEVKHPLVQHKLGLMRVHGISTKEFRDLSREIGSLLCFESTKNLDLNEKTIQGWAGDDISVQEITGKKITLVPILRAGLGMLDGVMQLIPNAKISVVGLQRNEETLEPEAYFERLVGGLEGRTALILDPMLATGGTLVATIDLLKKSGCKKIIGQFLVAAPEGLKKLEETHPDVDLYVASIDERLNEKGYILPGLGDAGDKIFGTQ